MTTSHTSPHHLLTRSCLKSRQHVRRQDERLVADGRRVVERVHSFVAGQKILAALSDKRVEASPPIRLSAKSVEPVIESCPPLPSAEMLVSTVREPTAVKLFTA